jgi:putative ATP-binding cassette transporter
VAFTGILIYHFSTRRNIGNFVVARKLENKFLLNFNAILGGFKEIFMEPKKGRAIYENKIIPTANSTLKNNTAAFTGYLNNQITGQTLFYILISSVLLFLSITLKVKPGDTVSFVFTLLYLLGSIETIMVLIPGLMRARVASNHLADLKKELERSNFENVPGNRYMSKDEFESITISKLEFSYGDVEKSFSIGPVNLTIEKGEAIFIYGGNGSGKTTLIHSLLGICTPSAGQIRLNNEPVGPSNYRDYKAIFSVVFNDFYLFEELYGIDNLDIQKLNFYLRLFELEEKVEFEGRSFSTTTLSMGQRKRLALITCLLEEKPVLVLDEWAADQDPYFRKKFYKEIIPLLKKDGFTIIAITHDDKYYPYADRLYKMDDGKLIEDSIKKFETTLIS